MCTRSFPLERTRRAYPEVSFSIVGAVATALMGVSVDPVMPGREADLLEYFANQLVMTLPQRTPRTAWAELQHIPVRQRCHDPTSRTVGRGLHQ